MNPDGNSLVNDCVYVVLDQRKMLSGSAAALQTKLFNYWFAFWNDVLNSVGVQEKMDPNEFYSQHKITALLHGPIEEVNVVAMHTLSFFDRSEFRTSRYFQNFDHAFLESLEKSGVERLMTLQYFGFTPSWKKMKVKPIVSLPMTIASLSMLHKELENVTAVASVARKDVGASNALYKMNFQDLLDSGSYNNTPVTYQLSFDPKTYPHEDVERLTPKFWNSRVEISNEKDFNFYGNNKKDVA